MPALKTECSHTSRIVGSLRELRAVAHGPQPTRKWGSHSDNIQELNSATPGELRGGVQIPDQNVARWCLNFSLVRLGEANPATVGLDSWPTGLWVNKSMLSEATKCVAICYAAIENHYCTCLRRCERTGTPRPCWWEHRKHSHLEKEFGSVFKSWASSYQKTANLCLVFTQEK